MQPAINNNADPSILSAKIPPDDFLIHLHKTAMYVFTRSVPFFLRAHFEFLTKYVRAWLDQNPDPAKVAGAFVGQKPSLRLRLIMSFLQAEWIPDRAKPWVPRIMVASIALSLWLMLIQFIWSVGNSAWHVLKKGIRSVPPLITAVVVVFVTSDAWRILGTGFTSRFLALVGTFMIAGLLFLIRFKDYWEYDIAATDDEAGALLRSIGRKNAAAFQDFIHRSIRPAPMVKPEGFGAFSVYASYVLLSLFSLIATAIFVSGALIFVGIILVSKQETVNLAGSAHVYATLPGHLILTRQLVSLSLSLGAFSAFFLVAAQHTDDRKAFMNNVLIRLRRALLVYSIYYRARYHVEDLTPICVKPKTPDQAEDRTDETRVAKRIAKRSRGNSGVPLLSIADQARSSAMSWARDVATAGELKYVAYYTGPADQFHAPHGMLNPSAPTSADIPARCISYPGRSDWDEFQAAIRDFWESVKPLLERISVDCGESNVRR